jgi:hypothetical protein
MAAEADTSERLDEDAERELIRDVYEASPARRALRRPAG